MTKRELYIKERALSKFPWQRKEEKPFHRATQSLSRKNLQVVIIRVSLEVRYISDRYKIKEALSYHNHKSMTKTSKQRQKSQSQVVRTSSLTTLTLYLFLRSIQKTKVNETLLLMIKSMKAIDIIDAHMTEQEIKSLIISTCNDQKIPYFTQQPNNCSCWHLTAQCQKIILWGSLTK